MVLDDYRLKVRSPAELVGISKSAVHRILTENFDIKVRKSLAKEKVLFHLDNAPVHTSVIAIAKINEVKFTLLPHAPYLPNLAPSDYFLFPNLKKWLGDQRFTNNEEMESAVNGYFEELNDSHYKQGIKAIEQRCAKRTVRVYATILV